MSRAIAAIRGSVLGRLLAWARSTMGGSGTRRDPLGPAGERLAVRHLRGLGYHIIGCNLRVPMGEADVLAVAPDGRTVVLVEVKSRRVEIGPSSPLAPPPEASITARKREKLVSILRHLARSNGWMRRELRIDAIAIEWPAAGMPELRHHEGAVKLGR